MTEGNSHKKTKKKLKEKMPLKAKKLLVLKRPLKNIIRKKQCRHHNTIFKVVFVVLVLYVLVNLADWKEHWDSKKQDILIQQQKMDPVAEQLTDAMDIQEWAKPMQCKAGKRKRLAFLKTHKTGGGTLTGILNRFTDYQQIDIAIPKNDVRFNWPASFSHQEVQVSRLKDRRADMLNLHSVLNRPELGKIMKPGFKLVTILREPVRQFYSMFYYLNLPKHYGIANESDPVSTFMENPYRYHHFKPFLKVGRERYFEENLIHNGNLYDLDFTRFQEKGKDRGLRDFIQYLEKAFHLVMITEKYDESLLLLKKLMCWDFMDIVYMKKHVNHNLQNESFAISNATAESIRGWNYFDAVLYNHFSKRLDEIIGKQDKEKFKTDLMLFRELNDAVVTFCLNNSTSADVDGTIQKFDKILEVLKDIGETPPPAFLEKPDCFCTKMKRNERDYMFFFAKRFPPFYFMKGLSRPQSTDDC
ncbi:galactose-3-O-sulfotransferase 3-like [Clytia hemisphaerica]|uniref:Galactosylceramide sulfotransferase-like n=1 Tax=Clytia hemisphaerica TaxID=252671 RepID=A0A7M5X9W6_9CNID